MTDPAETPVNDLLTRLREACNDRPACKVPWPHRLLHEAADAVGLLAEAEEALGWYGEQLQNGTLCRNIERDGDPDYLSRMVKFVTGLKRANSVLARIRAAKEKS